MTRLILQAGFSGDNDLVSPERGYNGFPGLGSCQIGWGGVRRIVVSLCRSGIKSPSALSLPFLLSRTQNSVLLKPSLRLTYGVLQKQDMLKQWPSLTFFLAAQNRLAACHVWRQIAIRNAVKPIPITIMVPANYSFQQSYINTVCSVNYCFTSPCLGICFSKFAHIEYMEFSKSHVRQEMIFAALFFVQKRENYTICARVV
jgi:hypothetical protein